MTKSNYFLLFTLVMLSFNKVSAQKSATEKTGDVLKIALPATALTTSLVLNDKHGSWQFLKSYGLTLLTTYSLKYIIDKPSPEGDEGYSFPSGHTSSAFSGAAFIQKRYGWKYGVPAYLLAGFVGWSRIEANKHDGWDVLGGTIVGIGSVYLFTKPYQKNDIELSFSKRNDNYIIILSYRF